MICIRCGKEISDESVYCMFCGRKQTRAERKNTRSPNGTGTAYKRGKTWTAMVIKGYVDAVPRAKAIKMTKGGLKQRLKL